MSTCRYEPQVERWFDGELPGDSESVAAHVANCNSCAAYLDFLEETRAGVEAVAEPVEISEGQFPAFLASVRESIESTPSRRLFRGFWGLASVACAALISTAALFMIYGNLTGGQESVSAATEVESHGTDIPGAVTEVSTPGGTTTVMIQGWGDYDYATDGDMM